MRKPSSRYAVTKRFHDSPRLDSDFTAPPSVPCCRTEGLPVTLKQTVPPSALTRFRIRRKRVVFPAPLLPTRPMISPAGKQNSGIKTAVLSPNFFIRLLTDIATMTILKFLATTTWTWVVWTWHLVCTIWSVVYFLCAFAGVMLCCSNLVRVI